MTAFLPNSPESFKNRNNIPVLNHSEQITLTEPFFPDMEGEEFAECIEVSRIQL